MQIIGLSLRVTLTAVLIACALGRPLGLLALLFTPVAMIIAQTILIVPISVSLKGRTGPGLHRLDRDRHRPGRAHPCIDC